ncbi:hypothetical protein [Paraburkholderia sp. ZP32-5]|uniref:hypothetical protein n=1 Tax=Paraburkholderia sp. ZP32-5 TaxID=2883245 RepID=UPI001F40DD0C|nr:hypothetical protein [Paraburkholderia sp. ZP32-5]
MSEKYYIAVAASVDGHEQSDYLCFIKIKGGGVIGYAAEFDACTTDIADACTIEKTRHAKWFAWDDEWEWCAATLDEIRALRVDKYLIGSKKDMKLSTPIEPL